MEIILYILLSLATASTDLNDDTQSTRDSIPELSLAQKSG